MTHCHSHVLITGASGFVGRALVARIATPGTRVSAIGRSLERLTTAYETTPQVACFAYGVADAGRVTLADAIRAAVAEGSADARVTLVHLAGAAHDPALSDSLRGAAIDAITDELVSGLTCLPGARVVNVSSIAARPDQYRSGARLEAFGRAKARSETLLGHETHSMGGGCVSLRPPAIWGPGAPGSFAAVRKVLRARLPLPIDSLPVERAYLHIDRLTGTIATLAAHDWPRGLSKTFELTDPKPYTIKEIFAAVAAAEGVPLHSFPVPALIIASLLKLAKREKLIDQVVSPLQVSSEDLDRFIDEISNTGEIE